MNRRVAVGTVEFIESDDDDDDTASIELKSENETESISTDEAEELYAMQQDEAGHADFIDDDSDPDE